MADSSFDTNVAWHVGHTITGASMSPSGRDVALAASDGIRILDLDNLRASPRLLSFRRPQLVADIQWSPHAARESWIVSASGTAATIWDLNASKARGSIQVTLRQGHMRTITDMNFSAHHTDILATSGIDSFVAVWDIRIPSRPVVRLADWRDSGLQVKWNRQDENLLASSHGNRLHIWDQRKGVKPLRTISGHKMRILGIDWNRQYKENIMTCSEDETIKLWNWARTADPNADTVGDPIDRIVRMPYPVWRARHTPFGQGIITVAHHCGHAAFLFDRRTYKLSDRDAYVEPKDSFGGHNAPIKDFLWRFRGNVEEGKDQRDFQLLTWSTDGQLRLHQVSSEMTAKVGFSKGMQFESTFRLTRVGAAYKSYRTLDHEHPSLIAGMTSRRGVSEADATAKKKTKQTDGSKISHQDWDPFKDLMARDLKSQGNAQVNEDAQERTDADAVDMDAVSHSRRGLLDEEDEDDEDVSAQGVTIDPEKQANVPKPATFGARWSPSGVLVWFRTKTSKLERAEHSSTLRFHGLASQSLQPFTSRRQTYEPHHNENALARYTSEEDRNLDLEPMEQSGISFAPFASVVYRQDAFNDSSLQPIQKASSNEPFHEFKRTSTLCLNVDGTHYAVARQLAEQYKVAGDAANVCSYNEGVARKLGYDAYANTWAQAAIIAGVAVPLRRSSVVGNSFIPRDMRESGSRSKSLAKEPCFEQHVNWGSHPFGTGMIERLLNRHAEACDTQMLAMLSLVFAKRPIFYGSNELEGNYSIASDGQLTPHGMRASNDSRTKAASEGLHVKFHNQERFQPSHSEGSGLLLNPRHMTRHYAWRSQYADQLQAWGMDIEAAEFRKRNQSGPGGNEKQRVWEAHPVFTSNSVPVCSICRGYVRGLSQTCLVCNHVSHLSCWFEVQQDIALEWNRSDEDAASLPICCAAVIDSLERA